VDKGLGNRKAEILRSTLHPQQIFREVIMSLGGSMASKQKPRQGRKRRSRKEQADREAYFEIFGEYPGDYWKNRKAKEKANLNFARVSVTPKEVS
jgi:hypothetical protein